MIHGDLNPGWQHHDAGMTITNHKDVEMWLVMIMVHLVISYDHGTIVSVRWDDHN